MGKFKKKNFGSEFRNILRIIKIENIFNFDRKKGNNPGIVFVPYIIQTTTPAIIESNFSPRMTLKSRYSTTTVNNRFYIDFGMKNWRRKSRIEKIYKIEKPTEE